MLQTEKVKVFNFGFILIKMFKSRQDAGKKLGKELKRRGIKADYVFAIPRGGVPVAYEVAFMLKAKLDVIVPRKLPIPADPEAGFGAVIGENVELNKGLLEYLNLSKKQIDSVIEEVRKEINRRTAVYRGKKPFPILEGKKVIIVDDGLASGYTMLAAIKHLEKKGAKVTVAVPVSSSAAFSLLDSKKVIALHISTAALFAVADFYSAWTEMSDEEVIAYLKKAKEEKRNKRK